MTKKWAWPRSGRGQNGCGQDDNQKWVWPKFTRGMIENVKSTRGMNQHADHYI